MAKRTFAGLLLGAGALALAPAGASAGEPHKVSVKGKRDSSTIVIKGVRDPSAWFKAESEHLIVYSDDSEEQAVALVENLERLDYVLRLYMKPFLVGADGARKFTLYFRRTMDLPPEIAMDSTVVVTSGSCVSATQAFALDAGRIWKQDDNGLLKADDVFTLANSMSVYAGYFLHRHTNIRGPGWFVAGFRAYFGGILFSDGRMRVGRDAGTSYDWLQAIDAGEPRMLTFEKVLHRELPKEAYESRINPKSNPVGYYANWEFLGRSFTLLHYMLSSDENRRKMALYLERVNDGGDPVQAFSDLFGLAGAGIDGAMLRYRTKDMKILAVDMPELPKPAVEVTRLSRIEGDFVLDNAVVTGCPAPGRGSAILARLQAKAAAAPAVDFAQLTLSRAQIEWGDPRDALPYLRRAAERDPYDPALHYLLGLAHLQLAAAADGDRAGLLEAARAAFAEAALLQPGMPEVAYGLFRAELLGGGEPSERGVALALDAWRDGHDVVVFARAAALAQAWLGDAAGAYQTFTTLVRNEGDPANAAWAADWLDKLEKGVPKDALLAAMRAEKPAPPAFRLGVRDLR